MFLHNLKYELKDVLRTKDLLLWAILFPIMLGGLFKFAFGSVYEKNTKFSAVPAAVVMQSEQSAFRQIAEAASSGEEPLLDVTFADEETALGMLKEGEVTGIFYAGETVTLTVSGTGIRQTILQNFAERSNAYVRTVGETAAVSPEKVPQVLSALSADVRACTEQPLTDGNTDQFLQFFYNLIAMVAIFGSLTGLQISVRNQANLSALGARKNCSPTPKSVSLAASLTASLIAHFLCMIICVTYLVFVLRVDLGSRLPAVYGTALLGGSAGVAMGFFIGSIGRLGKDAKFGINMAVSMVCCFLSGLMIGNTKAYFAEKAPWINRINPAAMISDCFYCLNLYNDDARFHGKLLALFLFTLLFAVLGVCLSGRKRYASI